MSKGERKRSDKVRERRKQGGRRSAARARSRRMSASAQMPPMVARRGTVRAPGQPKARKRAGVRRRYNVSLGSTGAEVRLPALPALRVGWRLVSGLLAVGILGVLYGLWTAPIFQVGEAEVVGPQRLSPREVNAVLGVGGEPVFAVDANLARQILKEKFPELLDVSIHVGLPASVVVEAEERQPLLAWDQAGFVVWVDGEGVFFVPRGEVEGLVPVKAAEPPPAIPAEEGEPPRLIRSQMVEAILALSQQAPQGAALLYDPQHGLGWVDPRGWQVYFGSDPSDVGPRLAVYQTIVETLKERGITPGLISLEYLHAPFYRMER